MLRRLINKITRVLTGKAAQPEKPVAKKNAHPAQTEKHSPRGKSGHAPQHAPRAEGGRPPREPRGENSGVPESRSPGVPRPPREPRASNPSMEGERPREPRARNDAPAGAGSSRDSSRDRGRGGRGRGGGRSMSDASTHSSATSRPGGAVDPAELLRRKEAHAQWDPASYIVAPEEGKRRFHEFNLPAEIMHAISELGFQYCTPIQSLSLENALAGRDITGKAQTGTGKTAAFLIAILTRYLRSPEARKTEPGQPRALVLAPTRELVIQICKDADALGKYCGLRYLAIYGGMDYNLQQREIQAEPVDLIVATPGRLIDFARSGVVNLSQVDTLVIDEADRMLDMGFIPDVRRIIAKLPKPGARCTMLYSATLNDIVLRLAGHWMVDPFRVEVESETVTLDTIRQVVYAIPAREKLTVLYNLIRLNPAARVLVFCNRRTSTEHVTEKLRRLGVHCDTISGDVEQNHRLRVLEAFRSGERLRVVIATDVAGRGIHVDNIEYVVNYDFPYEAEDYVHRIGRTGRAGNTGTAISFADEDESFVIPQIEKFIHMDLRCTQPGEEFFTPLPERNPRGQSGGGRRPPPPPKEEAVESAKPDEVAKSDEVVEITKPEEVAKPDEVGSPKSEVECRMSEVVEKIPAPPEAAPPPSPAPEPPPVEPEPVIEPEPPSPEPEKTVAEDAPAAESAPLAETVQADLFASAELPAEPPVETPPLTPEEIEAAAEAKRLRIEQYKIANRVRHEAKIAALEKRRAAAKEAGAMRLAAQQEAAARRKAERVAKAEKMNQERHDAAVKRKAELAVQRQATAERHSRSERYETPNKGVAFRQMNPELDETPDASTSMKHSNWRNSRATPPVMLKGPAQSEEWTPGG